jgi:hypothetical protein
VHEKKHINNVILRADCKLIRLHLGWNKGKSDLGVVQVTYLKINLGLGPNASNISDCEDL